MLCRLLCFFLKESFNFRNSNSPYSAHLPPCLHNYASVTVRTRVFCTCIYVYINECIHVYIDTYIYIRLSVCACIYTHISTCTCMCMYIYICVYVCVCMYTGSQCPTGPEVSTPPLPAGAQGTRSPSSLRACEEWSRSEAAQTRARRPASLQRCIAGMAASACR